MSLYRRRRRWVRSLAMVYAATLVLVLVVVFCVGVLLLQFEGARR